jgi:hypothetical protein
MKKYHRFWRSVVVVVGLMVAAMTVAQGASSNLNPGVLPPQSKPHGMSYAQWSVRWWQWVFSLPANNSWTPAIAARDNLATSGSWPGR